MSKTTLTSEDRPRWSLALIVLVLAYSQSLFAEQKKRLGDVDVHYVVVPSMYLSPTIAEHYDIVRGKDRAVVNISVVRDDGPIRAVVTGSFRNLLGQVTSLSFTEVVEDQAVYYLAPLRHSDNERLRFDLRVDKHSMQFQHTVFWHTQ